MVAVCYAVENGVPCDREVPEEGGAGGLCRKHYKQLRRNGKFGGRVIDPNVGTPIKRCWTCGEDKHRSEFQEHPQGKEGLYNSCRICRARKARERYHADPVRRKGQARRAKVYLYGLTPEDIAALLELQNGGCAVCGGPPLKKGWSIDHDHTCCPTIKSCHKCVRGLVCHRCNILIGMAEDSIDRLQAAIAYLQDPPMNRLREQQKETN